jgi:3-demethoxyubiquinol 3-hydroxylase
MEQRRFSPLDRLLGEIDRAIKTLSAPSRSCRDAPDAPESEPLSEAQRLESARLMRVNHSGEVAAQALYQGQALTARDDTVASALRQAAAEEADHLAWCEQRLRELRGRTSLLNPFWYAGSFALGAIAGTLGRGVNLGFVAETERQVESHLRSHMERLGAKDPRSRAILAQMTHDEVLHGANAASLGGQDLPKSVSAAMHLTGRLMTRSSYWV